MLVDSPQPGEAAHIPLRRSIGVDVYRPYPGAVQCSNFSGWILILAGTVQVVVGAVLFDAYEGVGCFWVGVAAWTAGIMGTCVSKEKNSGGGSTAVFFLLTAMCMLTATLGLLLVDGRAWLNVRASDGNCFDVSTCTGNTCSDSDCVCWKPDNSTSCDGGTSQRYCFSFAGRDGCAAIGNTEGTLLASSVLLAVIDALAFSSFAMASAIICCCRHTITLQRGDGIASHVASVGRAAV